MHWISWFIFIIQTKNNGLLYENKLSGQLVQIQYKHFNFNPNSLQIEPKRIQTCTYNPKQRESRWWSSRNRSWQTRNRRPQKISPRRTVRRLLRRRRQGTAASGLLAVEATLNQPLIFNYLKQFKEKKERNREIARERERSEVKFKEDKSWIGLFVVGEFWREHTQIFCLICGLSDLL